MWIYVLVFIVVFVTTECHANSTLAVTSVCSKVYVSGIKYQSTRKGHYSVLDDSLWCDTSHATYDQDSGSNYLFYIDVGTWNGWIIGTSKCVNVAGIVADFATESDPSQIPSSVTWYELSNGNWVTSANINVECTDNWDDLSIWEIIAIVFGVITIIVIIIGVIACCVHKKGNKPDTPHSGSRRIHVSTVYPAHEATYQNAAFRPTTWSSNTIQDTRYMRDNCPPPSYTYNSATSSAQSRNTTTTPLGPPPIYETSEMNTDQPARPLTARPPPVYSPSAPPVEYNVSERNAAFSPPPQYYE